MIYLILFVFGLCFGSFINALVWRIYKQEEIMNRKTKIDKKTKNQSTKYSILKGRSMCPNCKHILSALDLIPIISWVTLKGKCRYCKKSISYQYPFVEFFTAILFVASYYLWPTELISSWQYIGFITWLVVLIGLIALFVYDLKWMILPDKIVYPLIIIVILSLLIQLALGRPTSDLLGASLAALIGGGIFWILYQISGGKWIGGGDVKLGFLLGLIVLKPELAFLTLFLASVLGTICILPFLVTKKIKKNSHVPFGPFLIASSIIVVLFGQQIINWYQTLVLIQ